MPEGAAQWLQRAWYARRAPLLLRPLSWLFRGVVALRAGLYRLGWRTVDHPGIPVVVVGNITVGGAGKTPVVLWLAARLRERGVVVGIASRGYGGRDRGPRIVDAAASAAEVGDEALLLARVSGVPVCVARQRASAARELARCGCQLVLCDDGLQHLALRRDLEVAVVDARRGLGNGALLPAGPLREPARRLEQVDFVLLNGEGTARGLTALSRARAISFHLELGEAHSLSDGARRTLRDFAGGPVHAVAGIGDPQRFFAALEAAGLKLVAHAFPDHHPFVRSDLAFGDQRPVLMTQKDAVKCETFADGRLWCVPAKAVFAADDGMRMVDRIVQQLPGGGPSNRD
jgi:tetraacyldisaccharide 4'-kinase